MKHLLQTVFLLFSFALSAQNLVVGTTWYYHQNAAFGENGNYIKMDVVADTTIGGKVCKKITGGFGCAKIADKGEFVYIENKKAYRYDFTRSRFWLLYDWAANAGDIVTVYVPQPTVVDSFQIRIDSVNIWTPNGEPLRVQKITRVGTSRWLFATQQIIEKMGSNAAFFPQSTSCPFIQFGSLRCFNEPSQFPVKFVNYKCDTIIIRAGTSEILGQRQIAVFPTPSVSELNVTLDEPAEGGFSLAVVNTIGQVIWRSPKIIQGISVNLNINNWRSGIYNLVFTDKNGGKLNRKFVKTE
jgi:Secretion system C-terminal sorting domain